jgi:hypothetical protein
MSQKKHIDRLFQEKFKDFEVTPDQNVWANIEAKLNKNKVESPKKVLPIWFKFATIAASILILLTAGTFLINSDTFITNLNSENNKTQVSDSDKNTNASNSDKSTSNDRNVINNSEITIKSTKTDDNITKLEQPIIVKTDSGKPIKNNVPEEDIYNSNTRRVNKISSNYSKKNSSIETKGVISNKENLTANTSYKTTTLSKNTASKKNKTSNVNSNTKQSYSNLKEGSSKTQNSKSEENDYVSVLNKNTKNETSDSKYKSNKESRIYLNQNSTSIKSYSSSISNDEDSNYSSSNKNLNTLYGVRKPIINIPSDSIASYSIFIQDAKSIEAAITESERLLEKEKIGDRWSVSPNIAPVYYNSFGKGSQFGDQFSENNKTGEINTSYGISIGYALNRKLTIRTGVNKLNLSYDTDDVIVFESVSNEKPTSSLNIDFNNQSNNQNISVISADNLAIQQINSNLNFNAALSQRINYIEVPVQVEYALSENKFGINIIGGFSTFLLEDNLVVSEFDGYKTDIGKANNINNVSFSTNIGLGLNYKFSKSFIYIFEPTFKYQINGFSNTSGDFNPYIIGVYTGFSYKF